MKGLEEFPILTNELKRQRARGGRAVKLSDFERIERIQKKRFEDYKEGRELVDDLLKEALIALHGRKSL